MPNYATKTDKKYFTNSYFKFRTKIKFLASLEIEVDKLDIDKLKSLRNNLSNLKSKVHKLDINILSPVPFGLSKLSNVVKNEVVC